MVILQTQMQAMTVWKSRAQSSLDALRADISNLQSQRVYSRDEVDAMINALKNDQSWIKTEILTPPAPPISSSTSSSSAVTKEVWKYGTYRIDGSVRDIYFEGQHQSWDIIAVNTTSAFSFTINIKKIKQSRKTKMEIPATVQKISLLKAGPVFEPVIL